MFKEESVDSREGDQILTALYGFFPLPSFHQIKNKLHLQHNSICSEPTIKFILGTVFTRTRKNGDGTEVKMVLRQLQLNNILLLKYSLSNSLNIIKGARRQV